MSEKEIKNFIRKEYGLNHNVKIRNINMDNQKFTIKLGDCLAEIEFGPRLIRDLKLNELLANR